MVMCESKTGEKRRICNGYTVLYYIIIKLLLYDFNSRHIKILFVSIIFYYYVPPTGRIIV